MSVNKKVLSVAILGALFTGNAFAANLSAPGGAIPAYFAKEIIATPAAPVTLTTTAAGATLQWNIGYNFSDGEVRYARVQCSNNIKFSNTTAVSALPANSNIGSINGLGSNVLTFSVTSQLPNNVQGSDVFTVAGNHAITGTDADVTCSVGLYDQPSQAQAGGTTGLIQNTFFSGAYLSFKPSYGLVSTGYYTNTANVEADPAFTEFLSSGTSWPGGAYLGELRYDVLDPDGAGAQSAPFRIDGTPITLADLLSTDTTVTVAGDFSAFDDAWFNGNASDLDDASATFDVGNFPTWTVVQVWNIVDPIQESEYVATLNVDAAAPAVYKVTDISGVKVGNIVRNGTQLQAPLAQVPGGWISRMALTNTGSTARPYTIKVMGETGNTIGTANLTGTVPANGTTVVDLNTVLTSFTGAPRGTLNVTVSGPNNQIQGLYQIVNPESGSISNHVMVRPGTN